MKKQEKKIEWYNNPNFIIWLIIGIISLIILSSQSFTSIGNVSPINMVQNILNHNITYMIVLVYFISLKTKFGKKYFDYSNLLMILFFTIVFVTSILTIFQSFSLVSILTLFNNFLILIYFFHTFLRGTRFWNEFKLNKSPFNELGNDWYFNAIMVVEITLYAVSLISMPTVDGTFLATFDCIYVILLTRYIYLYGEYLNLIKKNCNNCGNFDEYREKVLEAKEEIVEKTNKLINEFDLDKNVEKITEMVEETVDSVKEKLKDDSKMLVDIDDDNKKSKNEEKYETRKNDKREYEKKGDK